MTEAKRPTVGAASLAICSFSARAVGSSGSSCRHWLLGRQYISARTRPSGIRASMSGAWPAPRAMTANAPRVSPAARSRR